MGLEAKVWIAEKVTSRQLRAMEKRSGEFNELVARWVEESKSKRSFLVDNYVGCEAAKAIVERQDDFLPLVREALAQSSSLLKYQSRWCPPDNRIPICAWMRLVEVMTGRALNYDALPVVTRVDGKLRAEKAPPGRNGYFGSDEIAGYIRKIDRRLGQKTFDRYFNPVKT